MYYQTCKSSILQLQGFRGRPDELDCVGIVLGIKLVNCVGESASKSKVSA
jgi:hypothetical protein